MAQRVAETAIGAGPMATLTELRDVDAPNGARSRIEPWRRVRLRWADPASRSILMQAFAISGVLVSYGLTLLLGPPPAVGALAALKALAVVLLLSAAVVAPVTALYRLLATWCIVLSAVCTGGWVLVESTDIFGPTTYGALDSAEIAAYGTWLVAYLLLRMRHPLTIAVAILAYCISATALCVRVMPEVRRQVDQIARLQPVGDVGTALFDEILLRTALLTVGFGLVALAWWLDGWFRQMLPLRAKESLLDDPEEASAPSAIAPMRRAWILFACFADPAAIVYAHLALRHARADGITPHDETMVRMVLGMAYSRLVLVMLLVTCLGILLIDPQWRQS